jgi:hypothetical protein
MLRPVENEEQRQRSLPDAREPGATGPVVPAPAQSELETSLLPRDHPKWVRDALTVSSHAKEMIARLKPVAVRILGFWDHRVRSAVVAGLRVAIDPSGSYRAN